MTQSQMMTIANKYDYTMLLAYDKLLLHHRHNMLRAIN